MSLPMESSRHPFQSFYIIASIIYVDKSNCFILLSYLAPDALQSLFITDETAIPTFLHPLPPAHASDDICFLAYRPPFWSVTSIDVRALFLFGCTPFQISDLPTPQKPHAYSSSYIHETGKELRMKIDVAATLTKFQSNCF